MPFHTPAQARERILAIGGMGSGKTRAWMQWARMCKMTRAPSRFYVLDTDNTVMRLLETEFPDIADIVEWETVFDWPEYLDQTKSFVKTMTSDDVLVIDMVTPGWSTVQEYYSDQVMNVDIGQYFLNLRKHDERALAQGGGFDGWKDWSVINRLYNGWVKEWYGRNPGHLFLAASVDTLNRQQASPEDKATYGSWGVKPRGQKQTGHLMHSVLWFQGSRPGDWGVTTIKDRGRTYIVNQEFTNFATDYLVNLAGWKLA